MSDLIDIGKAMEERVAALRQEEDECGEASTTPNQTAGITPKFVDECLDANELGDGILYATLLDGRACYNANSDRWYWWQGHHWEVDDIDRHLGAVEEVAVCYLDEARKLVDRISEAPPGSDIRKSYMARQKRLYRRVDRLRSVRGCNQTVKMAAFNQQCNLVVPTGVFDQDPWILPCANGVVDLRTGELRRGRPRDYVCLASPVEWQGIDTPAPIWERTIFEIFDGNQQMIDYIGRLFGYAVTGVVAEQFLPIFWGQGRNGKGVILEAVSRVMGSLMGSMQPEVLLDQGQARSAAAPAPEILALKGLRIAYCSEVDDNRRFSTSRVKRLTGGDTLRGRAPFDRADIEFLPTHTLILMTNNVPNAPADDFAFWERVHLVPFPLSFVNREPEAENERRSVLDLPQQLMKEDPGILAWLVRGCLAWQEIGLQPPPDVVKATKEYRRDEDLIQDFVDECLFLDKYAETPAAQIYAAFTEWWSENVSKKVLSKKKFGTLFSKKFKREKHGTYIYYGVGVLAGE